MWHSIKRYLANCNIHGTRYIVEDDLHWTERVFWLIICVLSWWGCGFMVNDSLSAYYNRPVAFTLESTYLGWETEFPSISICMRPHPVALNIARTLYDKKYGSKIRAPNPWRWLLAGVSSKPTKHEAAEFAKLTSEDIVSLYKDSISDCAGLMSECFWNSVKFNCCEEFKLLQTAAGQCYVSNSRHTSLTYKPTSKFIMNQNTGLGYMDLGLEPFTFANNSIYIQVYIHNNLEIPTTVTYTDKEITISKNKVVNIYFSSKDTFNEAGLRSVPPGRRRCRFADETENFYAYKWYSNNGCVIQLQMENMQKLCGCVSHLFPYAPGMSVCNYTGLQCINTRQIAIMGKEELGILCLPDCEGTVIRHFQNKEDKVQSSMFKVSQGIHLELLALPNTRYRRYVVRSLLDLVVAVGSTAGLFMGAGILSIVEIPYWLLLRHGS